MFSAKTRMLHGLESWCSAGCWGTRFSNEESSSSSSDESSESEEEEEDEGDEDEELPDDELPEPWWLGDEPVLT